MIHLLTKTSVFVLLRLNLPAALLLNPDDLFLSKTPPPRLSARLQLYIKEKRTKQQKSYFLQIARTDMRSEQSEPK